MLEDERRPLPRLKRLHVLNIIVIGRCTLKRFIHNVARPKLDLLHLLAALEMLRRAEELVRAKVEAAVHHVDCGLLARARLEHMRHAWTGASASHIVLHHAVFAAVIVDAHLDLLGVAQHGLQLSILTSGVCYRVMTLIGRARVNVRLLVIVVGNERVALHELVDRVTTSPLAILDIVSLGLDGRVGHDRVYVVLLALLLAHRYKWNAAAVR